MPRHIISAEEAKKNSLLAAIKFVDGQTNDTRTPNDMIDVIWACLTLDGHRGAVTVRAFRRAVERRRDQLMRTVQDEHDRIRALGFDAWHADTAALHRMTETLFRSYLTAHGRRWNSPDYQLPDDWCLVERLALACLVPGFGSWKTDDDHGDIAA